MNNSCKKDIIYLFILLLFILGVESREEGKEVVTLQQNSNSNSSNDNVQLVVRIVDVDR